MRAPFGSTYHQSDESAPKEFIDIVSWPCTWIPESLRRCIAQFQHQQVTPKQDRWAATYLGETRNGIRILCRFAPRFTSLIGHLGARSHRNAAGEHKSGLVRVQRQLKHTQQMSSSVFMRYSPHEQDKTLANRPHDIHRRYDRRTF
jgi:hypothetical protein